MKEYSTTHGTVQAIDIFCGIGGLTHGMQKAGIDVIAGVDSDASCKYAYEANNDAEFIGCDIRKCSSDGLNSRYATQATKVLVGCAPCQTFSKHTQKNKTRCSDEKWTLLHEFSRLIEGISPDVVSMENVPELQKFDVFKTFVSTLAKLGYIVSSTVVRCERYGIPQTRRRLVVLASKRGELALIPETHTAPEDFKTVADVIAQMPPLEAGDICHSDGMHRASILSELNVRRIRQSLPGGTWRDWDESLLPTCFRKESGMSYPAVYGRLRWDRPATTMTTQFYSYGTGRFGHPEQDRALSLREGGMLQTFPKKYRFVKPGDKVSVKQIGRHIGNAVPVRLGEVIGKSIMKHLDGDL